MKSLIQKSGPSPEQIVAKGHITWWLEPCDPCQNCEQPTVFTQYQLILPDPESSGQSHTLTYTVIRCHACGYVEMSVTVRIRYNRRARCIGRSFRHGVSSIPPLLDNPSESRLCATCRKVLKDKWRDRRHGAREWKRDSRQAVAQGRAGGKVFCLHWTKRHGPCTSIVANEGDRCDQHGIQGEAGLSWA